MELLAVLSYLEACIRLRDHTSFTNGSLELTEVDDHGLMTTDVPLPHDMHLQQVCFEPPIGISGFSASYYRVLRTGLELKICRVSPGASKPGLS